MSDGKLGLSLVSDNNKYNCVFKAIDGQEEAMGEKYDEVTGKPTSQEQITIYYTVRRIAWFWY